MRSISIIIVFFVISTALASAGAPSEAVNFLSSKMAEIKGEIPAAAATGNLPAPKCGTPVTVAIHRLETETHDMALEALQGREDTLSQTFGGPHILVHYTLNGSHAPYQVNVDTNPADGVPDYINRVLESFEYVWDYETGTLGYNEPLTDFGRGGDDRYDVYVVNLGAGFYGFTVPEDVIGQYRANSFIEIENDFNGTRYATHPVDGMQVTAAHEFFHAVQFAYDALEFDFDNINDPNTYRPWWLEASSTWMEDIVYDNINDYLGYLPYFLPYSWMGLGSFSYNYGDPRSYHPYGACLWPIYLTEKYVIDIMREIWTTCGAVGGYNALNAMQSALQARGSTFSDGFLEFAVWNFHTDTFADTTHFYSEGAAFPAGVDTTHYITGLTYQPVDIGYQAHPPEHLAANYIFVEPRAEPGGIVVNIDGLDLVAASWHVAILGYWPDESVWIDMGVDPSTGYGGEEWRDWDFYQQLVVIPTVSGLTPQPGQNYPYAGWVAFDSTLVGNPDLSAGFKLLSAYPSPFVISGGGSEIVMPYSLDKRYNKSDIKILIYDGSGAMIKKINSVVALPSTSPGSHSNGITWDGKNDHNEYVASGIYIAHMESGGKSSSLKIAVINSYR